ncbi:hypothetical protein D3C86_1896420 [compost metagenome]
MHIVKPCANLPDILHDEIARKILLKLLLVFKWIMELRKWHATGFKPAIHHLVDAFVRYAIDLKCNVIYPWAVVIFKFNTTQFS